MADFLLSESGDHLLLEDGTSALLDETSPGAGYLLFNANNGNASGTNLTPTNIPTRSVTATAGTLTFFKDTADDWWYRYNLASAQGGQFRTNVTSSSIQSFAGVLQVPTISGTTPRIILRPEGGARLVINPSTRQLSVTSGTDSTVNFCTAPVTIDPALKYQVWYNWTVGTTTSNGTVHLVITLRGSDTVLADVSNNACNTGTIPTTYVDVGSNDSAATSIDFRWKDVQIENDRTNLFRPYAAPAVPVSTIPTSNFDIIIGFIQSNMRGNAVDYDYPATDFYRPGVYQWDPKTNTIQLAAEPSPVFENVSVMNPMNRFSRAYVDGGNLTAGRNLLIVNLAEGGTGVTLPDSNGGTETWWPSETDPAKVDLFARATTEMQAVWAAVGTGSKVIGVLANHGSTDGSNNTPKATFKTRCAEVISTIQSFLYTNSMTNLPTLPYVFMQMRPSLIAAETRHKIIDDAQQELANEMPNVRYAFSPVGTTYERADSVHFNAAGMRIIGQNLYDAFSTGDNTAPSAGVDQTGKKYGDVVTLTATDPEGDSVTWTQLGGTTVTLSGTGNTRTFTVPYTRDPIFTFQASDGSLTDTMQVQVIPHPYWMNIAGVLVPYNIVGPAAGAILASTYTETWTGTSGSAWPAAWTMGTQGGTATINSAGQGEIVCPTGAYGVGKSAYLNAIADMPDQDIRVSVNLTDLSEKYPVICGRVGNNAVGGDGFVNSYALVLFPASNQFIIVRLNASGVQTTLATGTATYTAGTRVNVRFNLLGTTLRGKVWNVGTSEPSAWMLSTTDSTYTTGKVGLFSQNGAATTARTFQWDDFSVVAATATQPPVTQRFYQTTPQVSADPDTPSVNVGIEFYVTQDAYLKQIHYLAPASGTRNYGVRTGHLWSVAVGNTGTKIGSSVTFPTTTAANDGQWITYTFDTGIPLTANQRYRAAVRHPAGKYAAGSGYFAQPGAATIIQGILAVPSINEAISNIQNGYAYNAADAFPNSNFQGATYYVDVTVSDQP